MISQPIIRDFLSCGTQFLFIVAGSLFIFLIIAPLFGYIPYSANPGWHGGYFELTKDDFWENTFFMARWLRIFILYAIGVFMLVFAIIRFMEFKNMDTETVAYTSGILSAFLTGYAVHVAGWHIIIDTTGVVLAFFSAFFVGIKLIPTQPLTLEMVRNRE